MRLELSYVLPIRREPEEDVDELTGYLCRLSGLVEVIVVDGSDSEPYAEDRSRWGSHVRHMAPDPGDCCANGKAWGVHTGVAAATHDRVVVADDDVRYDDAGLVAMAAALDEADLVCPQNFFEPVPWHAAWDTGRSLVNRAWWFDSPGTLGVRRSVFRAIGGYDGDVLYENLELIRTVNAAGGRVVHRPDLYVRRRPPSPRRFLEQRPRQAYDDLAQPVRMGLMLAIIPSVLAASSRRHGRRWLAGMGFASVAMAEVGRRRHGGRAVFSARTSWWAPVWLAERGVLSWVAVWSRLVAGGSRYRGGRLLVAAHRPAQLRARHAPIAAPSHVAAIAERRHPGAAAPAQGDHLPAHVDPPGGLVLEHDGAADQQGPVAVGADHYRGGRPAVWKVLSVGHGPSGTRYPSAGNRDRIRRSDRRTGR